MTLRHSPFSELRTTTGWHFFVIAFLGRIPLAMNVVGVLTLITTTRGSITEGGIASAALGLSSGLAGPVLGAAADRWGQRGVLSLVAIVNSAALAGLIIASYAQAPLWVLLGACVAAGVSSPQVSPLTRVRWMSLLDRPGTEADRRGQLSAAMSYEGMADEVSFVGGPILVGALATLAGSAAPLGVSAVLTFVFVIAFAWHPTAAAIRPRSRTEAHRLPSSFRAEGLSLTHSSVLLPVAGMLLMGGFFGASLVSLTQFMGERGAPEQSGLLFGCMGISSAVFATLIARVPERITLRARWLASTLVILGASLVMTIVNPVWAMCLVLLLAGAAIGPLLVTLNTIGAVAANPRRFATTMVLLTSGITVGQALAAAVTGAVAEHGGYEAAVVVAVICAIAGVLTAAATFVRRPIYL